MLPRGIDICFLVVESVCREKLQYLVHCRNYVAFLAGLGAFLAMSRPLVPPVLSSRNSANEVVPSVNANGKTVPYERVFVVQLIEVTMLPGIRILEQDFTSQFYIEFRIDGGAQDAELRSTSEDFPIGEDGKPTFLPSALWYLNQLDFNNAKSWTKLDQKVLVRGDDLVCAVRFEGVFMEPMELQRFPFDTQDLTTSLAINCRTTGMTPVRFVLDHEAQNAYRHSIDIRHFPLHNEWELGPHVHAELGLTGSVGRQFPALDFSLLIRRKPLYYLLNVVYPMATFAFMANFQIALPRYETADRFSVCFSLLLTVVAFKFSISQMLPAVSYLTVMDTFLLACAGTVVLACFEAGAMGYLINDAVDAGLEHDAAIELAAQLERIREINAANGDANGLRMDDGAAVDGASVDGAPDRALTHALRLLRSSSSSMGDHGGGKNAEEMLWLMSQAAWAKWLDRVAIGVNVSILCMVCLWVYWQYKASKLTQWQDGSKAKANADANADAKAMQHKVAPADAHKGAPNMLL